MKANFVDSEKIFDLILITLSTLLGSVQENIILRYKI